MGPEELAARVASILSDEKTAEGLSDILADELLELSNESRVYIDHPKVVAAFLLAAAEVRGVAPTVNALREIVALSKRGATTT